MTTKIEIADNNMNSRFSCEVKNSLIFHKTEIIVILIHLVRYPLELKKFTYVHYKGNLFIVLGPPLSKISQIQSRQCTLGGPGQ